MKNVNFRGTSSGVHKSSDRNLHAQRQLILFALETTTKKINCVCFDLLTTAVYFNFSIYSVVNQSGHHTAKMLDNLLPGPLHMRGCVFGKQLFSMFIFPSDSAFMSSVLLLAAHMEARCQATVYKQADVIFSFNKLRCCPWMSVFGLMVERTGRRHAWFKFIALWALKHSFLSLELYRRLNVDLWIPLLVSWQFVKCC